MSNFDAVNEAPEQETVEISMEQAKEIIEMKEAVIRLSANTDFKKVIHQAYFHDEVLRLVDLRSDLMLTDAQKTNIDRMLYGIPSLKMFLDQLIKAGRHMEVDLEEAVNSATTSVEEEE